MSFARPRTIGLVVLGLLVAGLVAGCGSKESKWYGTYKNAKEGMTLVLQADHKATLESMGTKTDATWEITGDDKAKVNMGIPIEMFRNSDGSLRDEQGTVWKKA